MGHFVALGPLTFPNLNISTIWVRDPWVSIQINFRGSLPPTKEVLHTCKIVNFLTADLLLAGGAKLLGEWVAERGKGVGARRVGEGGWNLYLNEVFYKTGIVTSD